MNRFLFSCGSRRPARFHWAVATGAALVAGCFSEGPECYPVRGQVTLDGKPLAEAMVVFHPQSGSVEAVQKPIAYTDADGRFALTTLRPGDGAPPGDYCVSVELRAPRVVGEEVVREGRNLLPPRYAHPQKSGIKFRVSAGDNELPTIALKRS